MKKYIAYGLLALGLGVIGVGVVFGLDGLEDVGQALIDNADSVLNAAEIPAE